MDASGPQHLIAQSTKELPCILRILLLVDVLGPCLAAHASLTRDSSPWNFDAQTLKPRTILTMITCPLQEKTWYQSLRGVGFPINSAFSERLLGFSYFLYLFHACTGLRMWRSGATIWPFRGYQPTKPQSPQTLNSSFHVTLHVLLRLILNYSSTSVGPHPVVVVS